MWRVAAALCALLGCAGVPSTVAAADLAATGVRLGQQGEGVRFVLDLSGPAQFNVFTLSSPYRVVIDLPEVEWRIPAGQAASDALVSGFRYGLFRPGTSRVVLDLTGPARIGQSFLLPPRDGAGHRFVLDLERVAPGAFREEASGTAAATPAAPASAAPSVSAAPAVRKPGEKRVVVIDPGHGGVDPGALGAGGTREKEITLAVSKALRTALEKTGRYRVVMTRDRDIFVRLRERVAIARDAKADLFISVHADSIGAPSVRGASVYTLSEKASDKEAELLAAKENKADIIAGMDLGHESAEVANILIDLAQRETMNQSAELANLMIPELSRVATVLQRTHRFAGFAVLKAPDIPSILIELGYLSNRKEEQRLRDKGQQARIAGAIAAAVDAYFARQNQLSRS